MCICERCINIRGKVHTLLAGRKKINIADVSVARETWILVAYILQTTRYQVCRMSNRGRIRGENEPSWQRRAYERHRSRVKTARPTVDVNPPEGRPHVSFNAKRVQLERERQARILRDNFILLKKLREIMHRKRRVAEDNQRVQWQESRCVRVRWEDETSTRNAALH